MGVNKISFLIVIFPIKNDQNYDFRVFDFTIQFRSTGSI